MSRRRETWVYGCLCIVIVIGLVFGMLNPVFGLLSAVIAILTVAIIYVFKSQEYEPSTEPPVDPAISTEEKAESPITEAVQELLLDSTPEIDEVPSVAQAPFSSSEALSEEDNDSTQKLQQRIAELEKRVQSLNEQLAIDPEANGTSPIPLPEEGEGIEEVRENELSETAIQHLLETLDEKLANRSISKQLYTRLRDKYIARMEKAKKRRQASAKRGTKTPA